MGAFKNWLSLQEITMGSDGMRDNTPVQTSQATNQVVQGAMANPKFADDIARLSVLGVSNPSRTTNMGMDLATKAVDFAPRNVASQTNAANVLRGISTNLGMKPQAIKVQPGKVKLMRRRMRRM